jgi:hypothetical protein
VNITLANLDYVERETEREQREIREIHDRLAERIRQAEKRSIELHSTLLGTTKKSIEARHNMEPARFREVLAFVNSRIKEEKKENKELSSLKKHTEQLGVQLAMHEQKLTKIKELSLEQRQKIQGRAEEAELDDIVALKTLKQVSEKREEDLLIKSLNEDSENFRQDSSDSGNNANSNKEHKWDSDGRGWVVQFERQESQGEKFEYQDNNSFDLSEYENQKNLNQLIKQEDLSADKAINFTYKLSDESQVKVSLTRKREKEISLLVVFPSKTDIHLALPALKARLSNILQQSGFILHSLEVQIDAQINRELK